MIPKELQKEIVAHENNLPIPYSFKKLISIYRRLGKLAKKEDKNTIALDFYNRLFSLSKIWHSVYGHKRSGIIGLEVDRAEGYLKQLRKQQGSLYPYQFAELGEVKGDVLLSPTDYKNLSNLSISVRNSVDVVPESNFSVEKSGPSTPTATSLSNATQEDSIGERVICATRSNPDSRGKAKYTGNYGKNKTVEQVALWHYTGDGYEGLWSENDYWWHILALLYWDVIFAKLPGVYEPLFGPFPSSMQDMPRDMFSSDFFSKRKKLINTRHSQIIGSNRFSFKGTTPEKEFKISWKKHHGMPCRLIENWNRFSIKEYILTLRLLEFDQLVKIMDRLLQDFNRNRRGFPDLFLVHESSPLFVEVKRKGEKISQPQHDWHKFLVDDVGINVEICRVIDA